MTLSVHFYTILADTLFGEPEEVTELGVGDFVVGDLFVEGGFGQIEVGGKFLDGHDLGGHGGKLLGCEGRGSAWFGLTLQFCGSGTRRLPSGEPRRSR